MLMLHVDSENVQRDELALLPTPPATETWQPVGHGVFDGLVRESLAKAGIAVQRSHYGLSRPSEEGFRHRLFAILETQDRILDGQVGLTIGLRNSTDQSMSAGLVYGNRVFVCDNLAFAGEYVIRRKHTARILQDLPAMIDRGVGQFFDVGNGSCPHFSIFHHFLTHLVRALATHQLHPQFFGSVKAFNVRFEVLFHDVEFFVRDEFFKQPAVLNQNAQFFINRRQVTGEEPGIAENAFADHYAVYAGLVNFTLCVFQGQNIAVAHNQSF